MQKSIIAGCNMALKQFFFAVYLGLVKSQKNVVLIIADDFR